VLSIESVAIAENEKSAIGIAVAAQIAGTVVLAGYSPGLVEQSSSFAVVPVEVSVTVPLAVQNGKQSDRMVPLMFEPRYSRDSTLEGKDKKTKTDQMERVSNQNRNSHLLVVPTSQFR
jgi:hypothetical protein